MKTSPLRQFDPVLEEVLKRRENLQPIPLTGLPGGSKSLFLLALSAKTKSPLVIVTAEDLEADGLIADLEAWSTFLPANQRPALLLFPELDPAARIAALGQWEQNPWSILAASSGALSRPSFSPKELAALTFELRPGQSYPRTALLEKLASGGYERVDMVEMEGESAVRGEVMDIWPPDAPKPWRLLFDGDTLESLREFNSGTQRSEAYLKPQKLLPIKESGQGGTLADHAPKNTVWFLDEQPSPPSPLPNQGEGSRRSEGFTILYRGLPPPDAIDAGAKSTTGLASGIPMAAQEIKRRRDGGDSVLLFCHNAGEGERLGELLEEQLGTHGAEGLEFITGSLRTGFYISSSPRWGRTVVGGQTPHPHLPPQGGKGKEFSY